MLLAWKEASSNQVPMAVLDVMGRESVHSPELLRLPVYCPVAAPLGLVAVTEIVPVGVPELLVTWTVIVSVSPAYTGFGETVIVVVVAVGAGSIVSVR